MTAIDLIAAMRARGLYLQLEGPTLVIEAEDGVPGPTPEERELLRRLRPEVISILRGRAVGVDSARVSLYRLNRVLEVAVPWADVPIVIAPGCRIARELRDQDPQRGRVWCVCEVLDLLLASVPADDARKIAEAKLAFGGTVAGVRQA